MRDRLQRLWKLVAGFETMDIGNGYYMVKFEEGVDKTKVIDEGPWMIFDHYLTMQCWSPAFISPKAKIDKTMVWIRFPGLNLYFYDESILLAIVGKHIRVDNNTRDIRRGRFARVCVEVDLNKPVVGRVLLQGHWYHIEYEGLHRICATCGCYGSKSDTPMQTKGVEGNQAQGDPQASPKTTSNNDNNTLDKGAVKLTSAPAEVEERIEEPLHGEWLITGKNNRQSMPLNVEKGGINKEKIPKSGYNSKERIPKSHAVRDANKYQTNQMQKTGSSKGHTASHKPRQSVYANEKSKRQRKKIDPPPWPMSQPTWPPSDANKHLVKAPQVNLQ